MINAGQNGTYRAWLLSVLSSYGGQWKLLISAMSNVDERSRAKAITIIENSKYVNWITAPRKQDQIISFQPLNGLMSDDWTAEVSNKNYFNIFSAFATRFNRNHLWSFLDSSSQLKVAKMNKKERFCYCSSFGFYPWTTSVFMSGFW